MPRMQGNSVTIGGNGGNYYFIDWQLAGQNIANNNSTINWQAYFHYNNADAQLDNGIAGLSGTRWHNGGRVRNFGGQFTTRDVALASGSFTIGHNADGTQSLGVSGGVSVYQSGRSEGGQTWALTTIPRNSQVTTDKTAYTLGDAITVHTNRKASSFTHRIRIRQNNASGTIITEQNNVADNWTWTPTPAQITQMEAMIPNSNTLNLYIESYNNQVGQSSNVVRTQTLANANPTFSDFTFADSSTATVAITGSNQVLVRGKSTLAVTVSSANKMVAIKSATPDKYAIAYDGTTNQEPYKATGNVVSSFATIDTIGSRTIQVAAYDSRGNNTTVAKNVQVYDYTAPVIEATVTREGNFGANVTITTQGSFDLLPIGGANKNALTASSLKYRYRKVGTATWGTYVTIPFTVTGNEFTGTNAFVSLVNTDEYEFEFVITDKFGQVMQPATLGTGKPVLFVGNDSANPVVGIGKIPENGALDVDGDIYSNGVKVLDGTVILDEDDMSSNSATKVPSQQSVKAYVGSRTPLVIHASGSLSRGGIGSGSGVSSSVTIGKTMPNTSYTVQLTMSTGGAYWSFVVFKVGSKTTTSFNIDFWNNAGFTSGDMTVSWAVIAAP